ncbi:MAG: GerMN domain-containing protein [Treponema sp.]|jgi:hypothetical protein|nr:GerMN domain-containing protein [Treponema sp.]
MKAFFSNIFRTTAGFLASKTKFRLLLLVILCLAAVAEFFFLGLARRTFVFYNVDSGVIAVEDRMLKRSPSREINIARYTEEMLLGPVDPDLLPLFPVGTRLKSLLYRNGVVYADFSADAALPPVEGGETLKNFKTLHAGILRNFSYVREVRFFIDGAAAYVDEFREGKNGVSAGLKISL